MNARICSTCCSLSGGLAERSRSDIGILIRFARVAGFVPTNAVEAGVRVVEALVLGVVAVVAHALARIVRRLVRSEMVPNLHAPLRIRRWTGARSMSH